jgi:hypothetical protein
LFVPEHDVAPQCCGSLDGSMQFPCTSIKPGLHSQPPEHHWAPAHTVAQSPQWSGSFDVSVQDGQQVEPAAHALQLAESQPKSGSFRPTQLPQSFAVAPQPPPDPAVADDDEPVAPVLALGVPVPVEVLAAAPPDANL